MDANILKTAISSIMFVTEEDIRRLHAYNPKKEESRDVQYLLSLANIARNVSKSFASIENLIQTYTREVAGIDSKTWNRILTATVDIAEDLAKLIRENPAEFMKYIDLSAAAAIREPGKLASFDKGDGHEGVYGDMKVCEPKIVVPVADSEEISEHDQEIADKVNAEAASAIAAEISEQHRKEASA